MEICGEIMLQYPMSVVRFAKTFISLWCRKAYGLLTDIFYRKCFRTVLKWKCGSFQYKRTTNNAHFLFSYVATHTLCVYLILFKCGVYYRLFLYRSFHNLHFSKRNQLHTFFFVNNPPYRSCMVLSCNTLLTQNIKRLCKQNTQWATSPPK